jgi:putative DNA primase/helicase
VTDVSDPGEFVVRDDDPESESGEAVIMPDDESEPGLSVAALADFRWLRGLARGKDSAIRKTVANAALLLTHHRDFQNSLKFDSFSHRAHWADPGPEVHGFAPRTAGADIADGDWTFIQNWLVSQTGHAFGRQDIDAAIQVACRAHSYNPLTDWLRSLKWDGRIRLPTWLATYLGVTSSTFASQTGTWWLVQAVARALRPGCQADYVLVLEGPQGKRKSSALRALCPNRDWFLSHLPDVRDYERAAHAVQGRWIGEIGELDSLKRAAQSRIKDFLTLTDDTFRPPYGRHVVTRPRTCVLAGTTNDQQYLDDPTGGRRFWPSACARIDVPAIVRDRDQIWAEAVVRFDAGERWWPDNDDEHRDCQHEQALRAETDAWVEPIARWTAERDGFTTGELLAQCLDLPASAWDKPEQTRAGIILTQLGFERRRRREDGDRVYRYYRPTGQ